MIELTIELSVDRVLGLPSKDTRDFASNCVSLGQQQQQQQVLISIDVSDNADIQQIHKDTNWP